LAIPLTRTVVFLTFLNWPPAYNVPPDTANASTVVFNPGPRPDQCPVDSWKKDTEGV
jgi:hypothetical protein